MPVNEVLTADAGPDQPEVGDRDFIQSIGKGLTVLRSFSAEKPSFTLAELARETELSRAAVRRILLTLQALGYVEARGRTYVLRPRVMDLGYSLVSSVGLTGLVQPHLEELNREIRETCSVGVLADGEVLYVARSEATRLLSAVMGVGTRLSAGGTAIGRVLLSGLDDEEVREHLRRHPVTGATPMSITDPEQLLEEVRRVRVDGYCVADQELEVGFRAAAVPIRDARGAVVAGLNVGMHAGRVGDDDARARIVPTVQAAVARIERDLAMHPMPLG